MVLYYYSISSAKKNKPYSAGEASGSRLEQNMRTQVKNCVCAFDIHERFLARIPNDHSATIMEDAHAITTHPSLN